MRRQEASVLALLDLLRDQETVEVRCSANDKLDSGLEDRELQGYQGTSFASHGSNNRQISAYCQEVAGDGEHEFRAKLTGTQEVTTPPGGVDTDTAGKARFELNDARTELEFELEVEDGVRVTQAHIHCAPAGSNGPIIIFLAGLHDRGLDVDGDWIGDAKATDTSITNPACGNTLALIAEAMVDGRTYANVHTVAHPARRGAWPD